MPGSSRLAKLSGKFFEVIDQVKPRVDRCTPAHHGQFDPALYTGMRITKGRYIDEDDYFEDMTPWDPMESAKLAIDGKVDHSPMEGKWTGLTCLDLSPIGVEVKFRGDQPAYACGVDGCLEYSTRLCPGRCEPSGFCDEHAKPELHACCGQQVLLCEYCEEDFPCTLDLSQGDRLWDLTQAEVSPEHRQGSASLAATR